jgi:hypothetical protein
MFTRGGPSTRSRPPKAAIIEKVAEVAQHACQPLTRQAVVTGLRFWATFRDHLTDASLNVGIVEQIVYGAP